MKDWRVDSFFFASPLRNWSYLLWNERTSEAWAIDPFETTEILEHIENHQLKLQAILTTHEHWDHTQGNAALVKATGVPVWAQASLKLEFQQKFLSHRETYQLDDQFKLRFHHIPGHTPHHLGFALEAQGQTVSFFAGDTLFNAGVGNCRNGGNPEVLFDTINYLKQTLPDGARLYPGHDYGEKNHAFFKAYAPHSWVESGLPYPDDHFPSIGEDKRYNLFWRSDEKELQQHLQEKLQTGRLDKKSCFILLRQLRDGF